MKSYVGTIENYPYPYVINRLCWEFPCVAPSDWEAHNLIGDGQPQMLEDWKRALDVTVLKQGVMVLAVLLWQVKSLLKVKINDLQYK